MATVAPGVCRHCGCTEASPCALCRLAHDGASFVDREQLCCAAPPCVKAEAARVASAKAAAPRKSYRGWGYGAIVADMRREERRRKRRRKKAA